MARRYGVKAAAEVADFETANLEAVAEFVREEKVDCDFVVTRAVDVQFNEEQHKKLKQGYENLSAANVKSTKGTFHAPERYAEQVT